MEKSGEVKLISLWASPFVLAARIALNLKGVSYELLGEDLPFKKSQLLLDSNPIHKKVPVLIHNDKPICEFMVIVQYIDDAWPSQGTLILPHDPYDRAIARFWASYCDEKLFSTVRGIVFIQDEEERKAAVTQLMVGFGLLEEAFAKCSKGGKFFGADTIGLLDIVLGSFLGWFKALGSMAGINFLDHEKTPHLEAWAKSFCEAESVKDIMPEADKLVEFAGVLVASRANRAADVAVAPAPP